MQRLSIHDLKIAKWVVEKYCHFLGLFFNLVISVKITPAEINFYLFGAYKLLQLTSSPERSSRFRHLYYISDGLLVNTKYRGRFEFRKLPFDTHYIIAIYDFVPSLPWLVYRYSQAIVHLMVMKLFQIYIWRSNKSG